MQQSKSNKSVQIGRAIFKAGISSTELSYILDIDMKSVLLPYEWNLERNFSKLNQQKVFALLAEVKASIVRLNDNQIPNMIKLISEVRFTDLKQLHLCQNKLQSIEALQLISMPSLKKLYFGWNIINRFKSLRKIHIPNIQLISIRSNVVKQYEQGFAQLKAPHLRVLWIEFSGQQQVQSQSIQEIFKIQSKQLKVLNVLSVDRIAKKKIDQSQYVLFRDTIARQAIRFRYKNIQS